MENPEKNKLPYFFGKVFLENYQKFDVLKFLQKVTEMQEYQFSKIYFWHFSVSCSKLEKIVIFQQFWKNKDFFVNFYQSFIFSQNFQKSTKIIIFLQVTLRVTQFSITVRKSKSFFLSKYNKFLSRISANFEKIFWNFFDICYDIEPDLLNFSIQKRFRNFEKRILFFLFFWKAFFGIIKNPIFSIYLRKFNFFAWKKNFFWIFFFWFVFFS